MVRTYLKDLKLKLLVMLGGVPKPKLDFQLTHKLIQEGANITVPNALFALTRAFGGDFTATEGAEAYLKAKQDEAEGIGQGNEAFQAQLDQQMKRLKEQKMTAAAQAQAAIADCQKEAGKATQVLNFFNDFHVRPE